MSRLVAPGARRGVTLFELMVVLVLLGLAAALVTPALRTPEARPEPDTPGAGLRAARVQAMRRGETVRLEQPDGTWLVSPAGLCVPDAAPSAAGTTWDPVRCAPAVAERVSP
jgi:prepilin-type N-terminal cleavage/methylation domain-containing protein